MTNYFKKYSMENLIVPGIGLVFITLSCVYAVFFTYLTSYNIAEDKGTYNWETAFHHLDIIEGRFDCGQEKNKVLLGYFVMQTNKIENGKIQIFINDQLTNKFDSKKLRFKGMHYFKIKPEITSWQNIKMKIEFLANINKVSKTSLLLLSKPSKRFLNE